MNDNEHLLCCLAEEADEVGQRVMKALRFGLGEIQPGQTLDNAERIVLEIRDVIAVATLAERAGLIPAFMPDEAEIELKRQKIETFAAIGRQTGALRADTPQALAQALADAEGREFFHHGVRYTPARPKDQDISF